jgi:serine/threonine-protein kinase
MTDTITAWRDTVAEALAEDFRDVALIGQGGMGVVFRAIDRRLERAVAIKTLPPQLAANASIRERFLREARTAAALNHGGIVPIYSAGERGPVVYFSMGLVEGESLAERVARDGPLTAVAVMRLLAQLADALDYAHAAGVVHRDVKAENVLLDARSGRALLTDFGIARVQESPALTATGTVLGTVHYMSPEQVAGELLDGRSDLYAVGVMAYFALSGRFPFERPTASAVVVAHVNAPPPDVRAVAPTCPAALAALVTQLLSKLPSQRPASGRALTDRLAAIAAMPQVIVGTPATRLSSDDAQEIWARAAQLEANTGAVVPPPVFAPAAPLVTVGVAAADVRAAAAEAGIPVRYVDRALAERNAQRDQRRAVRITRDAKANKKNIITGAPTKLELEAVIDHEIELARFEEIGDEVRAELGDMINISTVGRSLTVLPVMAPRQGGMPKMISLRVAARDGRTVVRATDDLGNLVAGVFAGLGAGGGMLAGILAGVGVGQLTGEYPALIAPAIATGIGVVLLSALTLYQTLARRRERDLERLVTRVVTRISAGVTEGSDPGV